MRVYSGMLYQIDQSKLQFIFCYEGLQWYVISDRSVKVTVYLFVIRGVREASPPEIVFHLHSKWGIRRHFKVVLKVHEKEGFIEIFFFLIFSKH